MPLLQRDQKEMPKSCAKLNVPKSSFNLKTLESVLEFEKLQENG